MTQVTNLAKCVLFSIGLLIGVSELLCFSEQVCWKIFLILCELINEKTIVHLPELVGPKSPLLSL